MEPANIATAGRSRPHSRSRIFFGFLLLSAIALVCATYFSYGSNTAFMKQTASFFSGGTSVDHRLDGLAGRVYLTLRPASIDGQESKIGIYEFDLSTMALSRVLNDSVSNTMMPAYAKDEPQVLFASQNDISAGGGFQIKSYDERVQLPPVALTTATTSEIRFPEWSPDSEAFVFTSWEKSGSHMPNGWGVYLYRFADNIESSGSLFSRARGVKRIASGYNPVFSPDSQQLLYLKDDGVHAISREGDSDISLVQGEGDLSARFSVSNDGTKLVWAKPANGIVDIYTISGHPLSLTPISHIETVLRDPYFAGKDNEYLVGIADSKVVPGAAALIALDLDTNEKTELLELNAFDRDSMFVSGVRQ